MKNEIFSVLSEKIMPDKIKSIIWNKKIDIIVVLCDNYYEIHRIGFKHEDIYQKEEPCSIKQILFLEDNQTISVLLENSFMYQLSCSNCEVIVQKKLNSCELRKSFLPYQSYIGEVFNLKNKKICKKEILLKNPFYLGLHFNSFSKIDISQLSYFQNSFEFNYSYLLDTEKRKIDIFINSFINMTTIPYQNQAVLIKSVANNNILLLTKQEKDSLQFSIFNFDKLFMNDRLISVFFDIAYSQNILDYLNSITDIFQRLINKIAIIFFDKYIFANKLENDVSSENESQLKALLKEELKYLFYTGIMKPNLSVFLKTDLFEGKTIIKMDENIFFNLRNLEDIYVENIKSSLNILSFHLYEAKHMCNNFESPKSIIAFEDIEFCYNHLTIMYENLINQMSNLKLDYRYFLAWLNSFNTSNPNENKNNYLNSIPIDNDKIFKFIDEESYNMTSLLKDLDNCNVDKMDEVSNKNSEEVLFDRNISLLMDDTWTINYFSKKDYVKDLLSIEKTTTNNINKNNIKEIICKIKDYFDKINFKFKESTNNYIMYHNFMVLKGYNLSRIKKIKMFNDEINSYLSVHYTFVYNNKESELLILIKFTFIIEKGQLKTIDLHQAIINFTYDTTKIDDFEFQNKRLLLLVKSQPNSNVNLTEKFSIIQSVLSNYNFKHIHTQDISKDIIFPFDLNNCLNSCFIDKEVNDVIIDKYTDFDCSDHAYISTGYRGLFSVVDNRLNKLTIFDIYNN